VHAPSSSRSPHTLSTNPPARVINPLPSSAYSIPHPPSHLPSHPRSNFPSSTPTGGPVVRGRGTLGSRMGLPNLKFRPVKGCNCGKR
jgi:hypothetical protein